MPSPSRPALVVALLHALLGTVWILSSGSLAEGLAHDQASLAALEATKGVGYVFVTSLLVFGAVRVVLRRRAEDARHIHQQEQELAEAHGVRVAEGLRSVILHDVANMLTVVRSTADVLRSYGQAPPPPDLLRDLDAATDRVDHLVKQMGRRVHRGAATFETRDLTGLLREEVDLLKRHREVAPCELELNADQPVVVAVDPVLISQLVTNLIVNSAQSGPPPCVIRVSLTPRQGDVSLVVEDSGPGFSEQAAAEVMKGRYTSKATGSGLGLLSARACAHAHEGELTLGQSQELGGARVEVTFRRRPPGGSNPAGSDPAKAT